jgi:alkylation response protein AidB-like acyl-CoA dehydrogenase
VNGISQNKFFTALNKLIATLPVRALEIEQARRIPDDIVLQMKAAGVFRMFIPKKYGGLELDLPSIINAIAALARSDASVGWTAMIGAGSALFATLLPREAFERLYQDDPDTIIAGSTQLLGVIEERDGHWHAKGQWPFASGCHHATWMLAFCRPETGLQPEGGPLRVTVVVLPADRWTILDTWHVPGLKGSGSDDIALDTIIDPNTDMFDFAQLRSTLEGPLYAGVMQMVALMHGAVSLGIAEGALDDLLAIAANGRQQERAPAPMRDTEAFQRDLGQVHADIRAARAALTAQTKSHWQHARAGTLATDAKLAEGTQTAIWAVATCRKAVDTCFALGGSAAMYEQSPLQRRLRDIHIAAQHNLMQPRHYQKAGKMLMESREYRTRSAPNSRLDRGLA